MAMSGFYGPCMGFGALREHAVDMDACDHVYLSCCYGNGDPGNGYYGIYQFGAGHTQYIHNNCIPGIINPRHVIIMYCDFIRH